MFINEEALQIVSDKLPVGSMAFVQSTEALYVRIQNGFIQAAVSQT